MRFCWVSQIRPGRPLTDKVVRQIVDAIFLENVVRLPLVEGAADDPERLVAGRGNAQFLAQLLEVVSAGNVLARIDRVAGIVEIILVVREAAVALVISVVGVGVVGVVAGR